MSKEYLNTEYVSTIHAVFAITLFCLFPAGEARLAVCSDGIRPVVSVDVLCCLPCWHIWYYHPSANVVRHSLAPRHAKLIRCCLMHFCFFSRHPKSPFIMNTLNYN